MFSRPLKVIVGIALAAGGFIFVTLPEDVPVGTRFAITTPAVYDSLLAAGWDIIGNPRYSDDSTQVLFDKQRNVDFTPEELAVLADLDVLVLAQDGVNEYVADNGFTVQGGGE